MKKKTVTLIAAAVLAAAPIAGVTASNIRPQVVQADAGTPDSNAIVLRATLKKKTLRFGSPDDVEDERIAKDIRLNHGRVDTDSEDYESTFFLKKHGHIDWSHAKYYGQLKDGDQGKIIFSFAVTGLDEDATYTFKSDADDSGHLVWVTNESDEGIFDDHPYPAVEINFTVGRVHKPNKPVRRPGHKFVSRKHKTRRSRKIRKTRRSRRHVRRSRRHARRR